MSESLDPLLRDFIDWLAREPRSYNEAIEAWRTSCPRLTVWEDAAERGFVERRNTNDGVFLFATKAGLAFLKEQEQAPAEAAQ